MPLGREVRKRMVELYYNQESEISTGYVVWLEACLFQSPPRQLCERIAEKVGESGVRTTGLPLTSCVHEGADRFVEDVCGVSPGFGGTS